jgi:transposase
VIFCLVIITKQKYHDMDYRINNDAWTRIYSILMTIPFIHTGNEAELRLFIEAVFYMARTGCQWRFLPMHYGHWRAVHRRYKKWAEKEIWALLMKAVSDVDEQEYMIDSTSVRAHSCATGYKKNAQEQLCLGRSVGGLTTKIHALVDALGYPVHFVLSPGQTHDAMKADELMDYVSEGSILLADKAYDSQHIHKTMNDKKGTAIIPERKNRLNPKNHDKYQYKERHLVECFFNKIKHFRRVFSRFDKSVQAYLGFIYFVGMLIWLR